MSYLGVARDDQAIVNANVAAASFTLAVSNTAISTVGAGTLTAAALAGGFITRTGSTAAFTDTTDTAAAISAQFPTMTIGQGFYVWIANKTAFAETISGGTGVTMAGNSVIPANAATVFQVKLTAAGAITMTGMLTAAASIGSEVPLTNTTISTVGAGTLTAAGIVGGLITRAGTQIAAFSDATDTAANIIAAQPNASIGESWTLRILNNTTFPETVTAGTGVTLSGKSPTIAPNCFVDVLVTYSAAGAVTMLFQMVADMGIDNFTSNTDPGVNNDNTQGYGPGSVWINTTNNREWTNLSAATGAAVWIFSGAVPGSGEPSSIVTQFGAGTGLISEEGNINRQISAAGVNPGATGADNVLAVYSLPASSFDVANRGLTITAAGAFGATGNNKRIKLIYNPASAVVGSTVGAGGTVLADTGTVATNTGGWWVSGNVFKYGANGSNTQFCTSNGAIAAGVHSGISAPSAATATESGAILIAVTGNATTATSDIAFNWMEVNGMN